MSDVRAEFYEDQGQTWLRAKIVGDPNELIRKAKPEDATRWPREWEAHQNKRDVEVTGTPLEDVPMLNKDICNMLRMKGVRTAEELADMSDMAASRCGMGAIEWRKAAKVLLESRFKQAAREVVAEKPKRTRRKKDETE